MTNHPWHAQYNSRSDLSLEFTTTGLGVIIAYFGVSGPHDVIQRPDWVNRYEAQVRDIRRSAATFPRPYQTCIVRPFTGSSAREGRVDFGQFLVCPEYDGNISIWSS
jgi:hypothetical protein